MCQPVAASAGYLPSDHAGQVVFVELVKGLRASVAGKAEGDGLGGLEVQAEPRPHARDGQHQQDDKGENLAALGPGQLRLEGDEQDQANGQNDERREKFNQAQTSMSVYHSLTVDVIAHDPVP